MFTHILCPVDGSQASLLALHVAARLAGEQHASLTICSVADPARASAMAFGDPTGSVMALDALDDDAKRICEDALKLVSDAVRADTAVLDGLPSDAIVDYAAKTNCDLIVMGSHGRSGIPRALLGSVAEGVLRHAPVPVMIIRWVPKSVKSHEAS